LIKGEHIMADLTAVYQTYNNAGSGIAASYLSANNYKNVINQADVGRELIVKIAKTNMTDAQLNAYIAYITTSHGSAGSGDSAFVVAAVGTADGTAFESGVTDVVYLRVQGTGDLTVGTINALTGTPTATIEAIFTPAK
jgi:ABC-type sulfate transport system substrate-binding protein